MWSEAVSAVRNFAADARAAGRLLVLPYERIVRGDPRVATQVSALLGLTPAGHLEAEVLRLWQRQAQIRHEGQPLPAEAAAYVEHVRDVDLEAWVTERVQDQDYAYAAAPTYAGPPPVELPSDEDRRRREHREVQDALRVSLANVDTDVSALRARLDHAMAEIARRGVRLEKLQRQVGKPST